jgi:tRNA A37 N6-isopentenylltransferase MiaA
MEIRRKKGSRVSVAPELVHGELERIRNGGALRLEDIVAESEPADAVLHDEFTWENPEAAHKWRLYEARQIVKSVEIVPAKTGKPVRAYEATFTTATQEAPAERVFRTIDDVLADPTSRDELLGQCIRDLLALKRRYGAIQELSQVWSALDDFLKTAEV